MRVLAIEGALGAFSAAAGSDDGSLAERSARTAGMDALERGLSLVEDVLEGEPLASFDAIAVGTGPGGFTGRIPASFRAANALVCYGAAEGTAPALGERGFNVRTIPLEVNVPALAILRRAIYRGVFANPHGAIADYGEAHYAERAKPVVSGTNSP